MTQNKLSFQLVCQSLTFALTVQCLQCSCSNSDKKKIWVKNFKPAVVQKFSLYSVRIPEGLTFNIKMENLPYKCNREEDYAVYSHETWE